VPGPVTSKLCVCTRVRRFDCGSGMGVVRTKNKLVVGDWNHLRVRRRDWNGYIQLNHGPETGALSKVPVSVA